MSLENQIMKNLVLLGCLIAFSPFSLDAQTLTNGLVHHYAFDGNALDSTTNGNHLTVNGATLTTDRFGDTSAYHFTGGQYMTGNKSNLPRGNASRTVSLWLYLDKNPDSDVPFCWGAQKTSGGYGIAIGTNLSSSSKRIRHFGWGDDIQFDFDYKVNEWFHLVSTYDGDTGKVYINDTLVSSALKKWDTDTFSFYIGKNINSNPNDHFEGSIDDIRIYNREVSTSEVSALYTLGTLSTNKLISASSIKVYPNPTNDVLTINGINPSHVSVVNALGQEMKSYARTNEIRLSSLPVGIYYVLIKDSQSGLTYQKKVVKAN